MKEFENKHPDIANEFFDLKYEIESTYFDKIKEVSITNLLA